MSGAGARARGAAAAAFRARLALAALWLGPIGACASRPADTIELWAMGREGEMVRRLLPEFERQNPGLRVRVQRIPWSAAHEKLLTAYVGGSTPDVAQLGNTWIAELAALEALLPLDPLLARGSALSREKFFPGILDTNVVGGALYGIPWYVDTRLFFYRRDLLARAGYDAPPATWEEWRRALGEVKKRAGPDRYAILLPFTEWQAPVILALQRGATLLRDDDCRGDFRHPAFREAFDLYLDLFRDGLAPRGGGAQASNVYQDFADGYFAFLLSGPWNIGELRARMPAALADQWMTAPLPAFGPGGPGASLAGGASLSIFRGARNVEAAWKLVEFLGAAEQQIEFHRLTGDLPSRADAWEAEELRESPHARAFFAQLQNVRSTPKIPEWERIASRIARYAERAIRGEMSADQALAALDAEVDEILEKRRWMRTRRMRADR